MKNNDVAIVGLACRFPGGPDCHAFWQNLHDGVNSIQEIPPDRWDIKQFYAQDVEQSNKSNSKWCGIVEGIERFDNRFFNISPREANNMDPQQRLLLEEAWHCIEDSGIALTSLQNLITSVFVGVMANDYQQYASEPDRLVDGYGGLGNYTNILANRVSYLLGLKGPSSTINAACASSLVALHDAGRSILSGDCDYALVGGVNLNLHPWKYISFAKAGMLSPDGQCKTFDQQANGYVPGDGIAALLLQSLPMAVKEKNHIYGVIRGSAVNHNGQNLSITAPRVEAQRDLILQAYRQARISPETVSYVEAHGTGTSLGDPIEVEALTQAFAKHTDKHQFCQIGSVKSNIGHLEGAAGIAGVIKVLLMMRHRYIPRSLNIQKLNPIIDFDSSPFKAAVKGGQWQAAKDETLRAGVSSFGFGGANAHLLLEQAPVLTPASDKEFLKNGFPFLLSAKSNASMQRLLALWQRFINDESSQNIPLSDLCATLATGRQSHSIRFGQWVRQWQDLKQLPHAFSEKQQSAKVKEWHVLTGKLHWTGWQKIPTALKQDRLFNTQLTKNLLLLKNLDNNPDDKNLRENAWSDEEQVLYSFIIAYSAYKVLLQTGFQPRRISSVRGGGWLALTCANIVSFESAVMVLSGTQSIDTIRPKRPDLVFYDINSGQPEFPVKFSADYLRRLTDKPLAQEKSDSISAYITKAESLHQHQYTFKRYIEEWNQALQDRLNKNVQDLLHDDAITSDPASPVLLLLLVIINNCLQRLNQKWSLSETKLFVDARFYELVDLTVDGILRKERVLELCLDKDADLEEIAKDLNQQVVLSEHKLSEHKLPEHNHRYQLLRDYNQHFEEIGDLKQWLQALPQTAALSTKKEAIKQDQALLALGVADVDEPAPMIKNDFSEGLGSLLLQLWTYGAEIDWSQYYPSGSFQKTALPVYPFDGKPFWLKQSKIKTAATAIKPPEPASYAAKPKEPKETWQVFHDDQAERDDSAKPARSDIYCYRFFWEKEPLDKNQATNQKATTAVFIVADESTDIQCTQDYLQIVKLADPDKGLVDTDSEYLSFFNSLLKEHDDSDLAVFYLVDKPKPFDDKDLSGFRKIFNLTKALLTIRTKNQISLLLGSFDSLLVVRDDQAPGFAYGGLYGLAQSLMQEHAKFRVQIVDFTFEEPQAFRKLQDEYQFNTHPNLTAYRNGNRYCRQLGTLLPEQYQDSFQCKPGQVYLITGGLGGLGSQAVSFITQTPGMKLAILGRSALTDGKSRQLEQWRQSGSEVLYLQADVADEQKLAESLETIRQQLGAIHGVIHCGGIIDDKLLLTKTWDSFARVLKPKIIGGWLLNELTRADPLDFFAVFSSVVAVTGNLGQSDYAAANGFLDALIHYRQRHGYPGHSLSTNWTLWSDGGMGQEQTVLQRFSKRSGLITGKQALPAFFRLLKSPEHQVVVAGPNELLERTAKADSTSLTAKMNQLPGSGAPRGLPGSGAPRGLPGSGAPRGTRPLAPVLQDLLARTLHLDHDELDNSTDFKEYGLDLIKLTDFSEKINQEWDLSLQPALLLEISSIDALADFISQTVSRPALEKTPVVKPDNQSELASVRNVQSRLFTWLLEQLAEVLGEEMDELDENIDIRDFGMDSISLTNYAKSINKALGVYFDAALLFQLPTIKEIGDYILEQAKNTVADFFGVKVRAEASVGSIPKAERSAIAAKPETDPETEIAIIGISGRFPGAADVHEFWDNLIKEQDMITEIPASRWDWREHFGELSEHEDKTISKWGGFLNDIDRFDADFFRIPAKEAELMDPQQRLLLEEVWKTIEDAGYQASSLAGSDTGVFVGVCNDDYNELVQKSGCKQDALVSTGEYFTIIPNRVSYLFDFHGPSFAFDAACSSSLVAIHLAMQSIVEGSCELALAAGVNLCLTPRRYFYFSHAGMLSPDGRCKTFDKKANGYVRGEGVGVVLLKSLAKAKADKDPIYAVIKSSEVNHGGLANSLTAPNPNAQARLCLNAYQKANIPPETIGYIETHGTGTQLGDSIEINGLKKAFSQLYEQWGKTQIKAHCGLGSVKSNIGHLETAAGMAGLFKVLLSMQSKTLPATLHFEELNPYIQLEGTPFYIVDKACAWQDPRDDNGQMIPRRAGISSFGFGGANAHTVIEEYPKTVTEQTASEQIIVLSAKSEQQLSVYANKLADFLSRAGQNLSLESIAWTLQSGREVMDHRLAVLARSTAELQAKLTQFALKSAQDKQLKRTEGIYVGNVKKDKEQMDLLLDGEAGKAYIEVSVKNREIDKLAGLWVKGITFDWHLLHTEQLPQRVSLPSYPFSGKRYWIDKSDKKLKQPNSLAQDEYEMYYQNSKVRSKTPRFLQLIKKQQ